MKTIYIRGGDAKEPGALVLKEHLENKGHRVVRSKQQNYDAVVCWGCSMRDPLVRKVPALNANVNLFNKYQALNRFDEAHIPVPVMLHRTEIERGLYHPYVGPWFGRSLSHERGKDIQIFKTYGEILADNSKDFYTRYFEHTAELRAWVYKKEVFAWYRKHYRNPGLDNYKNLEYRSEFVDNWAREDSEVYSSAVKAVKALSMDFGAVDILFNEDKGGYVVLEVNSMPDISSTERVSGIRLANIVSRWAEAQ